MADATESVTDIVKRLQAIGYYYRIFAAEGYYFGEIKCRHPITGENIMPFCDYAAEVMDFEQAAYKFGWVSCYNWVTWKATQEAANLVENPDAIARCSVDQIAKLLTVFIRQERFYNGCLLEAFEKGWLLAILKRALVLSVEIQQCQQIIAMFKSIPS